MSFFPWLVVPGPSSSSIDDSGRRDTEEAGGVLSVPAVDLEACVVMLRATGQREGLRNRSSKSIGVSVVVCLVSMHSTRLSDWGQGRGVGSTCLMGFNLSPEVARRSSICLVDLDLSSELVALEWRGAGAHEGDDSVEWGAHHGPLVERLGVVVEPL